MHSIRTKIMAVTIAAILTSILALGGIGVLTIGVESDKTSAEKMRLISENMQMKLNTYLDSLQQSVDTAIFIAKESLGDPDIQFLGPSGDPEAVAKLDHALQRHCDEVERAFTSIASNTNGLVTYYYCINADYGSNVHGFFWSKIGEKDFVKQPDLDSSTLDPKDTAHTTWYYTPMKGSRPVWIGPYRAHFLGERWTISYVAPIFHQGFIVGVLGMDILFETMVEQINALKVYDTGFAFLMDRDGNVVYHPDMELGGEAITLDPNLDRELLKRRSTGDMLVRYDRDGQQWQLAFATLSDNHKVAVTAPVSEINATQRQLTLFIFLVAMVILALFTVVTLLLMNALTKPFIRLTSASQKLVAGDYDVELDYEGRDEVGILTAAFRKMRDHLKLYISDLNSRAYTDAMTGVKNKGAFTASLAKLEHLIQVTGREAPPALAVVVFDCNDLKHINDHYGHNCGDAYLQSACKLICSIYARSPVFRLGGDEFAVILQGEDFDNRNALLRDFDLAALEHNRTAAEPWGHVNIARGMAVYDPRTDERLEQTLTRADGLMYEDKQRYKAMREH